MDAVLQGVRNRTIRFGERTLPANPMYVFSATHCPCGRAECQCSRESINIHQARVDRIREVVDVAVSVTPQSILPDSSEITRERIEKARALQIGRNGGLLNARLSSGALLDMTRNITADGIESICSSDGLDTAIRVLRVARTIADLEQSASICARHAEEAATLVPARAE